LTYFQIPATDIQYVISDWIQKSDQSYSTVVDVNCVCVYVMWC